MATLQPCWRSFEMRLPWVLEGLAFAIYGDALMPWRFDGYGAARKRPAGGTAQVLTPPSIIGVLDAGYRPRWAAQAP
jgi:hypothetical protein